MNQKFHIALDVPDLERAIADYRDRLGSEPTVVIPHQYAVWCNETLNFSIRVSEDRTPLRHLGWENGNADAFSQDIDVNGIPWERFTAEQQQQEIERIWLNS